MFRAREAEDARENRPQRATGGWCYNRDLSAGGTLKGNVQGKGS
jgi:hypothetical protein